MGFDPVTMMAASAAIGLIGTGISAAGAYEKGQATGAAADYQAQVARNNAQIAAENVNMTEASGAARETIQGMKTRAAVGETKAAQGSSGVDVNSGSGVDVRAAEAKLGALDALTIRSNTAREAYGYQVKATSETAQAGLLAMQGSQARTAGGIDALGTFLNGAASVGGKFAGMQLGTGGKPAAAAAASGPDLEGGIWPA